MTSTQVARAHAAAPEPPEASLVDAAEAQRVGAGTAGHGPDVLTGAARRAGQLLLVAAAVAVTVWSLVQVRVVLVPVLIALVLCAALQPVVDRLSGVVPRAAATWVVLLTALGVLGGAVTAVFRAVRDEWSVLTSSVQEGLDRVQQWLDTGPLDLGPSELDAARQSLGDAVQNNREALTTAGVSGATGALEAVTGAALGLVTLFFLLKDGPRIATWALAFVPARSRGKARLAGDRAAGVLGGYACGTALIALVDAVVIGLALLLLGVPLALPLGVVVFLGAFVPLIGATVAGVLCALVALVTTSPTTALIVLGVVVVVNQVEGDVLAPLVLGRALALHPLVILLALASGTVLAGLVGAVLAVPLAAVAWTTARTWWVQDSEAAGPTTPLEPSVPLPERSSP